MSAGAVHPAAQGQTPQPPRVVPQRDHGEDVATLLHEMEGWFGSLKRTTAGFTALRDAFASSQGQTAPGERKKGLPVMEFKCSLIGTESREAVTDVMDFKEIDPQYLAHVLIPMINAKAAKLLEGVEEIATRIDMLRPILSTLTGQGAAPGAA